MMTDYQPRELGGRPRGAFINLVLAFLATAVLAVAGMTFEELSR